MIAQVPQKTVLIEILVKECTQSVHDQANTKVSELTLFPTESDIWAWDPFKTNNEKETAGANSGKIDQTTYSSMKELYLFQIDKLLKQEA